MLGSNSAGERDNAARMAEIFRRQHKITWNELLNLPPLTPEVAPEPKAKPRPAPAHPWVAPSVPWYERAWIYADRPSLTVAYVVAGAIVICYAIVHA